MISISNSTSCIQIPNAMGCAVNPRRFTAARRANAGNVIRQSSAFHVSSADVAYKGIITKAQADAIALLHEVGASIYLAIRGRVYVASLDLASLEPNEAPTRWNVVINFGIISEVAFK